MKRKIQSTLSALLILSIFVTALGSVQAAEGTPRYTGIATITSALTISETGKATCDGKVILWSGYSVDLTVELKRDGITIKTWTSSGSDMVSAGGTYYVASGHEYVVTTTATVYDSNGKIVESPSKDSPSKNY